MQCIKKSCSSFIDFGSQLFWARGTLILKTNLAAHLGVKKRPKLWKYSYICILSLTSKDLAAHLEKFSGTLVRRGTPVEKHCTSVSLSEQTTATRYRNSDNEYVQITNLEEGVSITELVPITRPQCTFFSISRSQI